MLRPDFEQLNIVVTVSTLVKPPYRQPSVSLVKPQFIEVERSYDVLVDELLLAQKLYKMYGGDVIHLDISVKGVPITDVKLTDFPSYIRDRMRPVLIRLRTIALGLQRSAGVSVLAMGKESVPVRISELTVGAYSVLLAAEKCLEKGEEVLLGLPRECTIRVKDRMVIARSLSAAEHDIMGLAEDEKGVLENVSLEEFPNPRARGFRVVRISPR